jgi:hypothetical protein
MNAQITADKLQFNSYEEWKNFTNIFNLNCPLQNIEDVIKNLCETENFTAQQKRNFISSDLKHDDIQIIRLYSNRIFVCFKDVEYYESEYSENGIDTLEIVYYPETLTWYFAY